MAKKLETTPDFIETLMLKVTENLTAVFKTFVDQLVSAMTDRVDRLQSKMDDVSVQLAVFGSRLDDLERRSESGTGTSGDRDTAPVQSTNSASQLDVLMQLEVEKADRLKRARNIIISGLPSSRDQPDEEVFLKFCEDNLTLKPKPSRCIRVGNQQGGGPRKLKITLENEYVADDLVASSHLLRQSDDDVLKNIYINRDLTPMEAKIAYEARQQRRLNVGTVTSELHLRRSTRPRRT